MKEYGVSGLPTFIIMKGSQKIDQVRGADRRFVSCWTLNCLGVVDSLLIFSGLENALAKYAGSGSSFSGNFSGKGQTLGGTGGSTPIGTRAQDAAAGIFNLDPQVRLLLGLVGGYIALYYVFFS